MHEGVSEVKVPSMSVSARRKLGDALAWCFLLACFGMLAQVLVEGSLHLLDGDASSELALARLLANENALISKNWIYSTELRVLNTQLVYAPLFKLFDSWRAVRITGSLILNIMLVASYLFMMRQTPVKRRARIASAGFLLLAPSVGQIRIVNLHTYYIPHIAIGFVLVGLMLLCENRWRKGRAILPAVLFMGLSFVSGLGGIRQLMVTMAPLFATLLLRAIQSSAGDTSGFRIGVKALWANKPLVLGGLGVLANGLGMAINMTVLRRLYTFSSQAEVSFISYLSNRGVEVFNAALRLLGYHRGSRVLSQLGIVSLLALCLGALLVIYTVKVLLAKRPALQAHSPEGRADFLWYFFAASFLVNTLSFLLTDAYFYELYYLPVLIWIVPLVATLMDQQTTPARRYQKLVACLFAACLVVNGLYSRDFLLERPREASVIKYGGLSYHNVHLADDLQASLAYLEEQGYQQGYASFWHANVLRELSDGRVECTGIRFPEMTVYQWLLERQQTEPKEGRGASFLLLSVEEYGDSQSQERIQSLTEDLQAQVAYQDEAFIILGFEQDDLVQAVLHR